MDKAIYLSENSKYIDDDSLAAIEQIPADKWATVMAAAEAIDAADIGLDCTVAATRETLDDFEDSRAKHWAERGKCVRGDGFSAYSNIQIAKGRRRQSLAVIDCGDIRIALTA
jgi:hypothetical protein